MRELLSEIAISTAKSVGFEFLAALVKGMREAMDAEIAFITTGIGDPPFRARSFASWENDKERQPFEYDLDGTPCRIVYGGETLVVSEGLYRQFPKENGYEGYIGVPLRGGSGKVLGHFAVLSRNPIAHPDEAEAIVKLFSLRAEAELQRLEHEREREALITSLAETNRRLARRQTALRQSNETRAMLLGMLAHDLRSPLAVISGRSELVQSLIARSRGGQASKARESCETIMDMAERIDRLITATLKEAQAGSQPTVGDVTPFPVSRAAEVAMGLNAAAATAKQISIDEKVPPGLMLRGDEDRIVEALDNLISNAIKYSHHGQRVEIEAGEDNGSLFITVRDEGLGLTKADQARAFRQFQRLSARPTAGESSTGLGLAIVRIIAEAHSGTATVNSAGKGRGTAFTLIFPKAPFLAPPSGTD